MKLVKLSAVVSLVALAFSSGTGFAAEDFYKGKTITIYCSGEGTYDAYARLFAKIMPRHIPGNPNMIVKTMSGASGLKATNYLYNVAPKDGTEIGAVHGQIPTSPFVDPSGVQYDPTKIGWIGSATQEVYLGYMWHTSPVLTMQDAMAKEAAVGGQAVGSFSIDMPLLMNELIGTKFKVITGYQGSPEAIYAVERQETNGHIGITYTNLSRSRPDWLPQKKISILAQFGLQKHKDMPDVPVAVDYAKGENKPALELYLARQMTARPYLAPPGIPADRLEILRRAFESALKDPEFAADALKAKFDITEPMNGEQLQAFVGRMSSIDKSAVNRLTQAFSKFRQGEKN
jgi:tripartite-type tricarboxylate transporter receptor subunit TctC